MSPPSPDHPHLGTRGFEEKEVLPNGAVTVTDQAGQDKQMTRFKRVLDQIRIDNIPSLAANIRQAIKVGGSEPNVDPSMTGSPALIGCKVVQPPFHGSYNIVFRIHFDDGVRWMLKVPANGHRGSFDLLAAQSLESEAQIMRFLKSKTSIPVPTVHSFNTSIENQIGCPYILMDHISGRPLYHAWFDSEVSCQKLKQIRARALQTIATSMVQLNQFKTARGGSLRFDQAGNAIDIGPAKAVDANVMFDRFEADDGEYDANKADGPEDDAFCEKGPNEDPMSALLFMLNRRGIRRKDSSFDRGTRTCLRMFIQMVGKHLNREGDKFVLAHPDFDMQNMLVDNDGTLIGVIDWDGVATVPHAVGALRFPNFLMRDWEPTFYNWNSEADEPRQGYSRIENSPEELAEYRVMYAQFIEMAFCATGSSVVESKELACITRSSILIGSLEMAASNPLLTPAIMSHIFTQIIRAEGQYYDEESSISSGSSYSSISSDDEDSDDEDSHISGVVSNHDLLEDTFQRTSIEPQRQGDREIKCPRCIQDAMQNISEVQSSVEAPQTRLEGQGKALDLTISPSLVPLEAPAASQIGLRKARLAAFTLKLGENGCRRAAQTLYRRDTGASDDPDDGIDEDHRIQRVEPVKSTIAQTLHQLVKEVEPSSGFIKGILAWLQSKLEKLQDYILGSPDGVPCRQAEQIGTDSESQSLTYRGNEVEHAKDCPRAPKDAQTYQSESDATKPGEITAKDVWDRIALEVKNCGITTAMLKGGQQMISAWIIDNLKEKAKREKALKEEEKKAKRKAERRAAKAKRHEQISAQNEHNPGLSKGLEHDVAQVDRPVSPIVNPPRPFSKTIATEDAGQNYLNGQTPGTAATPQGSRKQLPLEARSHRDQAKTQVVNATHSEAVKENLQEPEEPAPESLTAELANVLDRGDLTTSQTRDPNTHQSKSRQQNTASSEPELFEDTLSEQLSEMTQLAVMIAAEFGDAVPDMVQVSLVDLVEGKESLVKLPVSPTMGLALLQAAGRPLIEAEEASMPNDLAWQAVEGLALRHGANDKPNTSGTSCQCGLKQKNKCSCKSQIDTDLFRIKEAETSKIKHATASNSASTASESSSEGTKSSHTSYPSIKAGNQEPSSPIRISQGHDRPEAETDWSGELGPIRESTRVLVNSARLTVAEAVEANRLRATARPAVSEERALGKTAENLRSFDKSGTSGVGSDEQPHAGGDANKAEVGEEERDERGCSDHGGFNVSDVFFALGKGKIDKKRFDRLQRGFMLLLKWTVGGW